MRIVQQTFSVPASTRLSIELKAKSLLIVTRPARLQPIENKICVRVNARTHLRARGFSRFLKTIVFMRNSQMHITARNMPTAISPHLSP